MPACRKPRCLSASSRNWRAVRCARSRTWRTVSAAACIVILVPQQSRTLPPAVLDLRAASPSPAPPRRAGRHQPRSWPQFSSSDFRPPRQPSGALTASAVPAFRGHRPLAQKESASRLCPDQSLQFSAENFLFSLPHTVPSFDARRMEDTSFGGLAWSKSYRSVPLMTSRIHLRCCQRPLWSRPC